MPYADPKSEAARACARAAAKRYYERNREREIARSAQWNKGNRERLNERMVEWRSKRRPVEEVLWWNARNRAVARDIEFTITLQDIVVPERCPVLGMPLVVGTGHAQDASPSLDRLDPAKGYVSGNVRVISHKANTIKSNASAQELRRVLAYMEGNV